MSRPLPTGALRPVLIVGAGSLGLGVVVLVAVWVVSASLATRPAPLPTSDWTDEAAPSVAPTGARPDGCPDGTLVTTAAELQTALDAATAGDVIVLAAGSYVGEFTMTAAGTADAPITLCGTAAAVLDGGAIDGGYVVHLDGAAYWHLVGFTVTNGQKGVMADGAVGSVISGLTVTRIGDEGIHLRRFSTDNLVTGNVVDTTGLRRQKFGEGIYVGSAESNWCDISGCAPDTSDRNVVEGNVIRNTTAESIDIKEGTTGGVVRGNTFDGSGMTGDGGDSWVDVKGNAWLIEGNSGVDSPRDGFQTHEIVDGWGTGNVFRGNSAAVNGPGFGFSLTPVRDNVVACDNTASGAGEGLSNARCTSG